MDDRQTGTVWTHYDGKAIQGAEEGQRLEMILLTHIEWAEWVELHPDTLVLDINTGFENRYRHYEPGAAGLGPRFQQTLLSSDDRLPENELVLGVQVDILYRAYRTDGFSGVGILEDTIGESPVVIFYDGDSDYALAYNPVFEDNLLTFEVVDGVIYDQQTRSVWTVNAEAVEGELAGAKLTWVSSFITEWYGWAAYHPTTDIYGYTD